MEHQSGETTSAGTGPSSLRISRVFCFPQVSRALSTSPFHHQRALYERAEPAWGAVVDQTSSYPRTVLALGRTTEREQAPNEH